MNKNLIEIPEKYNSIEEKLEYLEGLSIKEKNRDRMEMDYTYSLYLTKEYYKNKLKNNIMVFKFREIVKKQEFYLFETAGTCIGDILREGHYVKETYRDGSYKWFEVTERSNIFNKSPLELVSEERANLLDKLHIQYLKEVYGENSELVEKYL